MLNPLWLALVFISSEIFISTVLRSKQQTAATDKGSLRTIWIVVNISVVIGITASFVLPQFRIDAPAVYWIGLATYFFGLALRWYSIVYLGRFFTVDVTVRADQSVIDSGPYRFVRHPSYTGVLLTFAGLALCFGNYLTLVFLTIPTTLVFLHRINVEEAVLQAGLGEAYRRYVNRTKRLLPFIY